MLYSKIWNPNGTLFCLFPCTLAAPVVYHHPLGRGTVAAGILIWANPGLRQPPPTGRVNTTLAGYYSFAEGSGQVVQDLTANGNSLRGVAQKPARMNQTSQTAGALSSEIWGCSDDSTRPLRVRLANERNPVVRNATLELSSTASRGIQRTSATGTSG